MTLTDPPDDVMWPQKVKFVTSLRLTKTAGDAIQQRSLITMVT